MGSEDRTPLSELAPSSSRPITSHDPLALSVPSNWRRFGNVDNNNGRHLTRTFESTLKSDQDSDSKYSILTNRLSNKRPHPSDHASTNHSTIRYDKSPERDDITALSPSPAAIDITALSPNPSDPEDIDITTLSQSPDLDSSVLSSPNNQGETFSTPLSSIIDVNDTAALSPSPTTTAKSSRQNDIMPPDDIIPTMSPPDTSLSGIPPSIESSLHIPTSSTGLDIKRTTKRPKQTSRNHLRTGYIYDVYMSYHATLDVFDIHPEDPRRLFYIFRGMRTLLDHCERIPIKKALHCDILAVHTPDLLRVLKRTKKMTRAELMAMEHEFDSIYVNNHSYEASLYAAGGVIEMCRAVVSDQVKNGFAIVRPPGHHAESNVSMGFCFINNVAIATKYCMEYLGLQRIMIVDWDVHFGNGTHEIFADDPNVVYLSLHRYDEGWFYPADDAGAIENVGEVPALGKSINIAWPTDGTTDADYLYAFHQIVMPIGYEFKPDLVIVSAGFDAAEGDDIGQCRVTPAGYGHMTHLLKSLANGRLVMALEGGYNLQATSASAAASMAVLMGEAPLTLADARPSLNAISTIDRVKSIQSKYWESL